MGEENESYNAIELIERAWDARREKRLAEAHTNLLEAVSLSRQSGAQRELVLALRKLGHVELDLGNNDSARAVYEEAITICRVEGDLLTLAHTVRHLGDVHRHAGRVEDAEACYQEALELYRSHEQPPKLDLANAIRPIAILKEDAGMVQEAKTLWAEARDLYRAVDVKDGVAECSDHLARLDG